MSRGTIIRFYCFRQFKRCDQRLRRRFPVVRIAGPFNIMKIRLVSDTASLPGHTRLAAEVSYGFGRGELLWFDIAPPYENGPDHSGNGWLMALLPLAFERGEKLEIFAPVDALLLQNAERIQQVWMRWFPGRKPVPIRAPVAEASPRGGKTGLFFTGGVD